MPLEMEEPEQEDETRKKDNWQFWEAVRLYKHGQFNEAKKQFHKLNKIKKVENEGQFVCDFFFLLFLFFKVVNKWLFKFVLNMKDL